MDGMSHLIILPCDLTSIANDYLEIIKVTREIGADG